MQRGRKMVVRIWIQRIERIFRKESINSPTQIHEKGYHLKYAHCGRKIFLLGINFDTEKRAITEWKLEGVDDLKYS